MKIQRSCFKKALFVLVLFFLFGMAPDPFIPDPQKEFDLEIFVRKGCPHCEVAKRFVEKLSQEQPQLRILIIDVGDNSQALIRLKELSAKFDIPQVGVPSFFLRDKFIVGFTSEEVTGRQIRDLLGRPPPSSKTGPRGGVCDLESTVSCYDHTQSYESSPSRLVFPIIGLQTLSDLGLPLFTVLLGLLDGFNPCAMWVLLFLLSLLATLRDRKTMALIAGTFVLMSGLIYFVFMAAWLNVFLVIGYSRLTQIVLGVFALVIGMVNVADGFNPENRFTLSIPDSAKPGLFAKMRNVVQAKHLGQALVGVILLAGLVNIIELACTAGFPAMYTQLLTLQNLSDIEYYSYLGLYNIAYILDDGVMAALGVITLSHRKLQVGEGRWLKSISGVVMISLGMTLIVVPEWLL
jgi:glutaredoxin